MRTSSTITLLAPLRDGIPTPANGAGVGLPSLRSASLIALACVAALAAACGSRPDHVVAARVSGELPRTDPFAAAWEAAPEFEAPLQPQNVIAPHLAQGSVERVRVRALHDGRWIAFRLEWEDSTEDVHVTTTVFSDAAAVQLPRTREERPTVMMGNEGGAVDILFFRAAWQTEDNMGELYPNMPPIHHPPEAAAEGAPREEMERHYRPALAAGNPTVTRPEGASVMAFSAEGYGTLSPPEGGFEVGGRGVYRDGRWAVVIAREIGEASSPVAPGPRSVVAFAVWNGSNGEVGARKNRSDWIELEVPGGGS